MVKRVHGISPATAETGVPTAVADGDDVNPWVDEYGRLVGKSDNLSVGARDVNIVSPLGAQSGYRTLIDETLDDSPTSSTSTGFFIGDCDKVSFILSSDITDGGAGPSVAYTFEVSPDNSTWYDCDIIMTDDGEDAPVSSVSHSADAEETAYLPSGFCAQYIRVIATGTNTDATNTVASDVIMMYKKG